jgi:hypothetical protein
MGGTYHVRLRIDGDSGCSADEFIMAYDVISSMCSKVGAWEILTDRPGSDYRDFEYAGVDPGRCQAECDNDPKCRSWTFVGWIPNRPHHWGVQAEHPTVSKSHCWLKNAVPDRQWAACCISGVKGILGNTDIPGGDYKSLRLTSSDPATCKTICERDQRCIAWTAVGEPHGEEWDPDRTVQVCWLKDKRMGPPVWKTGMYSGTKQ